MPRSFNRAAEGCSSGADDDDGIYLHNLYIQYLSIHSSNNVIIGLSKTREEWKGDVCVYL